MERRPLVSVIVPTYNRASTLGLTLSSIVGQTFRDFEVIVVDDGSIDDSRTVAESLLKGVPYKYIYQQNGGEGRARETGMRNSQGEYLALCDSDDAWLPDKLEKQMVLFTPDTALVYSDAHVCNEMFPEPKPIFRVYDLDKPYRGEVYDSLIRKNFVVASSAVVRKSFLHDFVPLSMPACHDWPMWLTVAREKGLFDYAPEPLVYYYEHADGMSRGKKGKMNVTESRITVRKRELNLIERDVTAHENVVRALRSLILKDTVLLQLLRIMPGPILDKLGTLYYRCPSLRKVVIKMGINR